MSEEDLPEKESAKPLFDETASRGSVGAGIAQVLLLHLLQIPAAGIIGWISLPIMGWLSLPVICVTQLVYVIPAFIIARRKGHENTVKGIIIAASLTALLNIACTGLVFKFVRLAGFYCGRLGA